MCAEILVNSAVLSDVDLMVFDKDGTIIDVHAYWTHMVRLRSDIMSRSLKLTRTQTHGLMDAMGVDVRRMRVKPTGPVGLQSRQMVLRSAADYLNSQRLGDQTVALTAAFAESDRLSQLRLNDYITPIAGMPALIDHLVACGCKMAIATTDSTHRATLAMEHLGIASSIDFVAGADLVDSPKPAPDILHLICQRLQVPVSHTVMIGDSVFDVLSGVNAGCKASIGVLTGLTGDRELRAVTPHVLSSIADLTVTITPSLTHSP